MRTGQIWAGDVEGIPVRVEYTRHFVSRFEKDEPGRPAVSSLMAEDEILDIIHDGLPWITNDWRKVWDFSGVITSESTDLNMSFVTETDERGLKVIMKNMMIKSRYMAKPEDYVFAVAGSVLGLGISGNCYEKIVSDKNIQKSGRAKPGKLGATSRSETWERCGNSPFFRKGEDTFDASLVSPVDLVWISTNYEKEGPPGYVYTLYRGVPEIDLKLAKKGASSIVERKAISSVLSNLEQWKDILETALQGGASRAQLISYFGRFPADRRDAVLEGVQALIYGWEDVGLENAQQAIFKGEYPTGLMGKGVAISRLAIQRDSPAHERQAEIEGFSMVSAHSVVDENLESAYWQALQDFGVLEC